MRGTRSLLGGAVVTSRLHSSRLARRRIQRCCVSSQCNKTFPHSEIGSSLADYFIPEGPKFPAGGRGPRMSKVQNYLQLVANRP